MCDVFLACRRCEARGLRLGVLLRLALLLPFSLTLLLLCSFSLLLSGSLAGLLSCSPVLLLFCYHAVVLFYCIAFALSYSVAVLLLGSLELLLSSRTASRHALQAVMAEQLVGDTLHHALGIQWQQQKSGNDTGATSKGQSKVAERI